MKRYLFALLSAILLSSGGSAQQIIRVAAQPGTEPYWTLLTAVYEVLGYKAVITEYPSERALAEVNSGRADAEAGRVVGELEDFPNLVYSSEPIINATLQAWARRGTAISISSPKDLKNYRIGTVRGIKLAELFAVSLSLSTIIAADEESLAKMLDAGRIDIALLTDIFLVSPVYKIGVLVDPDLVTMKAYHVFNKKYAFLIPKWDAVLRAMKADGRYQKLISGH